MAEFKLGRIKFVWKDNWVTGTTYYKDDIVAYGSKTYICVAGHDASADFYTDLENIPTKWNQFSDGQEWKGDWSQATLYKENDIVKYGGYLYICNNGHTSSTTLEANQADWDLIAESFDWKGSWVAATVYKVNDLVKYGGYVYLCNTAHTAAATDALGLEDDAGSWDIFSKGTDWKGSWDVSTRYKVGDQVKYGGTTYVCNEGHTSAATDTLGLEDDQSKWDYFNQGIEYTGVWTTGVRYKVNDVVKSGGGLFICVTNHTSANFVSDIANWNQFVEGVEFESDWVTGTEYQPGDIVRYGGNTYITKIALNAGSPPSQDPASYDLFTTGFRLQGDWNSVTAYKVGEIVRLGGFTYVATADGTNHIPPNASYWSKMNEGINWEGDWVAARSYNAGDSVKYGPNSYICILAHSSTTGSDRPDNDITGVYWNLLTAGNEESVLTTTGDLVYYSGAGPTRLPIGDEGQVLSVSQGLPTWKYFGEVKNVWYVAPHGVNSPAPTYGKTIDKPWASLRYACEQIENGTEFPQAAYLLKMNRTFIQREIAEWVKYQITAGTGIWAGFVNDNDALCERDMGLIVDAIIHDLTHTGNVKTREATESYFNAAGTALITAIQDEDDQLVAAINYGVTVIQSVLANTAPAANYQTLNSVTSKTKQIIDTDYTAEAEAEGICVGLATIITDAVTAGTTADMPVEDLPNYTINLKTGQYYEVLPIHVPANTAIVGDELHSSRVSPQVKVIATNDKAKSITTLQRIQSVIDDIITNTAITPTTGNTETQDRTSQRAGTGSDTGVTLSISNTLEMKKILTSGDSFASAYVYPNPTGYNTSYLTGYGDARAQIIANKSFVVDEITSWIAYQVTNNNSPFTSGFTYDSAACARDVGYLVDAFVYDLTYGGNLQTLVAARSYFSNGSAVYGAGEKDEIIAAYGRLKDVLGYVITENTGWTKRTALTQDTSGTAGTATFVNARMDEIIAALTADTAAGVAEIAPSTSWVSSSLATAGANLLAAKPYIQTEAIEFINTKFPDLVYDETLCSRDVGYIVQALAYDAMFGSNYMSIKAAMSYNRGLASTGIVTASQKTETLALIDFLFSKSQQEFRNSTAISSVINNAREIKDIVVNGLGNANAYVYPSPTNWGSTLVNTAYAATGYVTGDTAGFDDGRRLILANKTFIVSEVSAWINAQISGNIAPFVGFTYSGTGQTKCERDVGYIVDALVYDMTYGGNLATVIAARSYYSNGVFVETNQKTELLAVLTRIKSFIDNIATGNTAGWTKTTSSTQDVSGTAGSADSGAFAQDRIQEIYDTVNTGTTPTTTAPYTTWVSAAKLAAKAKLDALVTTIQDDAVTYVNREFPALNFDETTCSRDVGYIVDALGYDMMFGSNFLSIQNGMSYQRGLSSTGVVLATQLDATSSIIDFIGSKASKIVSEGNVELANSIIGDIIAYVNSGAAPIVVGTNAPTTDLTMIDSAEIILLNKEFLAAEAAAYIADTFKTTVTASTGSTTDTFTCSSTSWMSVGDMVRFTGTVFGGVALSTTYYVSAIVNGTTFKISDELDGATKDLSTASGTMTVSYYYDVVACQNDIRHYVEAIAADMMYTGNYNSIRSAQYYRSALTGSKLENMFFVRNGCGVRNLTLSGLDGTSDGNTAGAGDTDGLTAPNEFGTQRPKAGAYVSLDPGWGPNDYRMWVTTRSTYVQNVTTFGTACIGQKIDGSIHAGGVDSIVSNDFTQVLSNGIGAWVTNLGRAELVSIFTYYNYIGYLAENGGKIRATNGNNSYGTYGSVAEGIDVTETPILGQINNRAAEANVRNVITDGSQVLAYEFGNAGSEYSSATFTTSGAGTGVTTVANEFRDGAVFNIRLTDPGDSSGTGGVGYITASNLAQAGTTTQITLAAADTQSSTAYVGMSIYLTAGTGAGQYGYIGAYNSGSKIATVYKESTGTAGWEHVVAGTPIEAALDVTTSYQITPRLTLTAPDFTKTLANDLPANAVWSDVVYGDGYGAYTNLSATGGSGSLATFDVTRRNGVYSVEVNVPGALYTAGNTLTIVGTSLGGTTPANDLTITVDTVNSPSGTITSVTASGTAVTPKYVAIASGTTGAAYSNDGVTWTAMTMPTATSSGGGEPNNQWSAIAYGVVSSIGYYVAVARATSVAAYSKDGITWTTSSLSEVADWCDIAYGNGTFVAIAESDSASAFRAVSTNGGSSWSTTSLGNGAKAIAYGGTRFVEVEGNFSNSVAYSVSGVAWTTTTLPANDDSTESNWVDIAYGNGRFVAISDSSAMAAYSFNGATWYKSNLPGIYEWTSIGYGQGVFYVTSKGDYAATSPDGVTWTLRSGSTASLNVTATAKDYIASTFTESAALTSGTWTDVIYDGSKFVAVGYTGAAGLYATSTNGTTWTNGTLPTVSSTYEYTAIAYNGTNKYVALIGGNGGTRNIAFSSDASSWTGQLSALSGNAYWKDLIWAGDRFVAMRGDSAAINHSTDGVTWTNAAVTSGSSEMSALAYGSISGTSYLVAVSGYSTGSQVASYSTNNGVTWTSGATAMPSSSYWADVTYGNSKFVAVAGGTTAATTKAAYSTNGTSWTAATMPGAAAYWNKVVYGGGAYIAFAYNSTRTAYSADGITWVEGPAQTTSRNWATAAYGGINAISLATGTTYSSYAYLVLNTNYLTTSSTTNLRVGDRIRLSGAVIGGLVSGGSYYITSVYDATKFTISTSRGGSNVVLSTGSGTMPFLAGRDFSASAIGNYNGTPRWVVIAEGSASVQNISQGATARARAYVSDNKITEIWIQEPGSGYTSAPTLTITDPNNTGEDATTQVRVGNGAIAQPMFTNRGSNYTAASAEITGNGYADNYQVSAYVAFMNLDGIPKAGSNVQIAGIDDVWYRLVIVTNLLPNADGTYNAQLQLSPALGAAEAPEHGAATIARRRYSQVRLTGHDLLDIGTGDIVNSNYPGLPLNDPIPAQEYKQANGGRVFYTSTDQDGNFRVGGLFNVEQSTGVATLNADAFNIAGLNQLSLGSVALGGSGATISEFSTDPFFTQDSDSVVPTQRAIKAYITSQIGGGGSSLNVNTLTAGVVYIAGQTIATTTNVQIDINTKVNFKGGIVGDALVLNYFLLNN